MHTTADRFRRGLLTAALAALVFAPPRAAAADDVTCTWQEPAVTVHW